MSRFFFLLSDVPSILLLFAASRISPLVYCGLFSFGVAIALLRSTIREVPLSWRCNCIFLVSFHLSVESAGVFADPCHGRFTSFS